MKFRPQSPRAAIVIFGAAVLPDGRPSRTLRARTDAAARFGSSLRTPLFIPTGAVGRHGPSEAAVMRELLLEQGIPADLVVIEETGTDTLSSVRAVRRMLRAREGVDTVFVATSAYHLPRCVLLLRLAGVRAHRCPPPQLPASRRWWRRWYWRLREIPAIPYDAGLVIWLRVTGRL
ncbi:MAG: YdcF family protein [Acetobacteraceae bacterium]